MNWADVVIIAIMLIAVQFGVRMGLVRQVALTVSLVVGLIVVGLVQWMLCVHTNTAVNSQFYPAFTWLLAIILLLILGLFFDLGYSAGKQLSIKLKHFGHLQVINQASGALIAGVTVIVLAWFGSSLLSGTPNELVASQVKNSLILNNLKRTFPQAPTLLAQAGNLLDPHAWPSVFAQAEPQVTVPQTNTAPSATVKKAADAVAASVVKVSGKGCGGIVTGSGFVASNNVVVTNAHVVAGIIAPVISDKNGDHGTQVIFFDPKLDLAVLWSSRLAGRPLAITSTVENNNSPAATLGYATGSLKANTATIISNQQALGYDIYNLNTTSRHIYTIAADIEPGDSGGPLINNQAQVTGMVFAKSSSIKNVGYALTADQVEKSVESALASKTTVSTGQCGID